MSGLTPERSIQCSLSILDSTITVGMFSASTFSCILRIRASFWCPSLTKRDTVFIVSYACTKKTIGFILPSDKSSLFDLSAAFSMVLLKASDNKGDVFVSWWASTTAGGGASMLGARPVTGFSIFLPHLLQSAIRCMVPFLEDTICVASIRIGVMPSQVFRPQQYRHCLPQRG